MLTLSVDRHVVARAKAFARANGTSVSRLVESMLDLRSRGVTAEPTASVAPAMPPVLTKLRGSMKRASLADYRRHLEHEYR